jgi:hypothetical protein
MRVDQLGLEIELEGAEDIDIFSTELYGEATSLLDKLSGKERVKDGINVLTNGLDHQDASGLESKLDFGCPVSLGELDSNHIGSDSTLDPLNTLELGIDEERVSLAGYKNSSILKRDSVSG